MKVHFLDTNIFLQCKDLEQLPWGDLIPDEELLLLIPRAVSKEIDHLKQDSNPRRAKRSRRASSFFKSILRSENLEITIRNSNPIVKISFAPVTNLRMDLLGVLDLSRPDDSIIAEAISYKNAEPDHEVVILTQDTNLVLTSMHCGLPFVLVPDEWLLPPESDPRDKKILELESRLKILEKSLPEIEIIAFDNEGSPVESLDIQIISYKELEECELKELVSMVEAANPKVTDFNSSLRYPNSLTQALGIGYVYEPPSKDIVEKYLNNKYPDWLNRVEEYFKNLGFNFGLSDRYIETSFAVNNVGKVPANDVTVEFRAYNGLLFSPSGKEFIKSEAGLVIKLPKAPKAPEGRIVNKLASTFSHITPHGLVHDNISGKIRDLFYTPPSTPRIPKDKKHFYWQDSRPVDFEDKWVFECEEFLHHRDPEDFGITLFVHPNIRNETAFKVECRVLVKNLPEPIVFRLPVRVKFKEEDLFQTIKELTESQLASSAPTKANCITVNVEEDEDT
jgi:hypothetical protein